MLKIMVLSVCLCHNKQSVLTFPWTVAEISLHQTAVLMEGGGAYLTCCNHKELTVNWIKRVKSAMAFMVEEGCAAVQHCNS